MIPFTHSFALFALAGLIGLPASRADDAKPLPGNLRTAWTEQAENDHPLPEYPRPQMVRDRWANLNGMWEYAIQAKDAARPAAFEGAIRVPFPVESTLSGVRRALKPDQRLWYRRAFKTPELKAGESLLLHFGAVDWDATVWVNDKEVGRHRGGYDAFTFNITEAIHPAAENEIVVSVWDPTGTNGSAHGKQNLGALVKPAGIMYTPCSGIWQTVWLEPVPNARIDDIHLTPLLDAGKLRIETATLPPKAAGFEVEAVASVHGKDVARAASQDFGFELAIPDPHPWTPDDPFLYDLRLTLKQGDTVLDTVTSYFGMRKIALGKDEKGVTRPMLNNKFVFQSGPLDQGYWPDGTYTAPTDEALKFDIEVTKKLGFNMTRKHVKVEPARWYYWCDRLGLMVWQDMPGSGAGRNANAEHDGVPVSREVAEQFEAELHALVEQHHNSPSIILWVVFNEGWGQYDTARLTKWVKQLDPSRLVNNASGWNDKKVGDVIDMHNYPGPGSPDPEPTRAAVLGEFGGLGLSTPEHTWVEQTWGYQSFAGLKALNRRYLDLWRGVRKLDAEKGLSAAVYTQLTDVETECNGLLTYDRKVTKVALPAGADAVARGVFPPIPVYSTLVPTAEQETTLWRYTTEKPADGWNKPDFDDGGWKEGPGGFGTRGTLGSTVHTEWKSPDIWIRRSVSLPEGKLASPQLRMHHDEDVEVYINGVLAVKAGGFTTNYDEAELLPEAVAALQPGAANVIAVHCHQTSGGQYIDLGIVDEPAR